MPAFGQSINHYLVSLVLVGVGWNFLFVAGSSLLATTHTEEERGKVQGINDLFIFTLVAVGSLLSGQLLFILGWAMLILVMLPLIMLVAVMSLWLFSRPKNAVSTS